MEDFTLGLLNSAIHIIEQNVILNAFMYQFVFC